MIRLRQVALVAQERDPVVAALCAHLGVTVCFEDPGVEVFGLHNALMTIGDQFIEVVSPVEEGTTAGRLLDRRSGDGGYMAIFECDDLDRRVDLVTAAGVRIVFEADAPEIRGRHLHPATSVGRSSRSTSRRRPGRGRGPDHGGPMPRPTVTTAIAGIDVARRRSGGDAGPVAAAGGRSRRALRACRRTR